MSSGHSSPQARFRTAIVVCLVLTIHAGLLAWQAYRYSPTVDEPAHLVAGLSHWKLGRFDLYRVNPPLVRLIASLPLLCVNPPVNWNASSDDPFARPEFSIGSDFVNSAGTDVFAYFAVARWACIPFCLIGACVCYCWAADLFGARAGMVALIFWCFCPNILGNGALITPDAAAAALGILACYRFWCWLRQPGWTATTWAGLSLGLCLLAKSSWLILFIVFPIIWAVWHLRPHRFRTALSDSSSLSRAFTWDSIASVQQLMAVLLLGLYLLNLGYGFEKCLQPLGEFRFISRLLGGPDAHSRSGNRFSTTALAALYVPLPADYLLGLDAQKNEFEQGKWSYLRGEQKFGGWWYYYLFAIGVKVPLGTLLALLLAAARKTVGCLQTRAMSTADRSNLRCLAPPTSWCDHFALMAPPLALFILVSSQTGFSRHMRYVLPCLPFLFVWASDGVRVHTGLFPLVTTRPTDTRGAGSILKIAVPALSGMTVVFSTISSLSVFPHNLSYFNELAGGPMNGPRHLIDSNVDWGQDLLSLSRWCSRNTNARPLFVAYAGATRPPAAGIHDAAACGPDCDSSESVMKMWATGRTDGWYAMSVSNLFPYGRTDAMRGDASVMAVPVTMAGYSIYIFQIQSGRLSAANGRMPPTTTSIPRPPVASRLRL